VYAKPDAEYRRWVRYCNQRLVQIGEDRYLPEYEDIGVPNHCLEKTHWWINSHWVKKREKIWFRAQLSEAIEGQKEDLAARKDGKIGLPG
jgi:hypothetical protein